MTSSRPLPSSHGPAADPSSVLRGGHRVLSVAPGQQLVEELGRYQGDELRPTSVPGNTGESRDSARLSGADLGREGVVMAPVEFFDGLLDSR